MHYVIRMTYLALVSHPDELRQIHYVIRMTCSSILCHPDDLTEVGFSSGWVAAMLLCHPDEIRFLLKSSGWDSKVRFSTTRGGPSALPYSTDRFLFCSNRPTPGTPDIFGWLKKWQGKNQGQNGWPQLRPSVQLICSFSNYETVRFFHGYSKLKWSRLNLMATFEVLLSVNLFLSNLFVFRQYRGNHAIFPGM